MGVRALLDARADPDSVAIGRGILEHIMGRKDKDAYISALTAAGGNVDLDGDARQGEGLFSIREEPGRSSSKREDVLEGPQLSIVDQSS